MLNGFSWPGQEACWGARLVSFEAYEGCDCDGDDGTPLEVRQLGVRGLCRWNFNDQLQPVLLVRKVSSVLTDHCFLLNYHVKFPDFKMLIADSN